MDQNIVFPKPLAEYCARLMQTQGVPADEAKIIGEHLVEAECCGLSSHGVSRTAIYLKRLETGVVNAKY